MKTILAVDDSPLFRSMLCHTLGGTSHYQVVLAQDGKEALWKVKEREESFALVITDINMPAVDGFTLVECLRKDERYISIPILVLTTESSDQMKQRGRQVGATGWMVKPFDKAKLLEVVAKLI